jgi:hypothetical protein
MASARSKIPQALPALELPHPQSSYSSRQVLNSAWVAVPSSSSPTLSPAAFQQLSPGIPERYDQDRSRVRWLRDTAASSSRIPGDSPSGRWLWLQWHGESTLP